MSSSIFDSWLFDHAQFVEASQSLTQEIERSLDRGTHFVYPLLGDSRTGKTAVLNDISASFDERLSCSGHKQVLIVPMPTAASNEALAVAIIQMIMGNLRVKGKTYQVLNQARETMKSAGTRVLMVDEANHLVEKRSTKNAQLKENRLTADWFKELGDQSGISVVLSGLSHVSRLYLDNDQLENRGLMGTTMYPYSWCVQSDRVEFENTINGGLNHMMENGWIQNIPTDLVTRVAYFGGGGYIGKAKDFLVRIEQLGLEHKRIDEVLLRRAFKDKYKCDFSGDPLKIKFLDDVLLNAAHQKAKHRALMSGGGR